MKYKIALIGCGRISFKHIEAFVAMQDKVDLVAVCDPLVERAEEKKAEYTKAVSNAAVRVFADYKEMLAACKPEVVTIATESGKHKDIAVHCLQNGSHVICEKPMALSTADAQVMIDTAKHWQCAFRTALMHRL